jgi:putative ABC transport system permease protein
MSGAVMRRLTLALRNIFRHRARTAATLAAISVGVIGLILASGFVRDIYLQLGEATIHSQTGHIQIFREGARASRNRAPEANLIADPDTLKKEIRSQPGVQQVVARLGFSGMINNGKRDLGVMGEGIEPDGEARVGTYMRYTEGRPLADTDVDGVVIGQGVAQSLNLKVGQRVTLLISLAEGAVNTLDFEIVGVFQSFSKEFDARAIRIPLSAARELLDTKTAHVLVVSLDQTPHTDEIAAQLKTRLAGKSLEVFTWREISDFYEKTVALYDRQFNVLRLIILLMVLLSVANSINMSLFERTREFGTMMAVGNRPRAIFWLIVTEGVMQGLLGACLGIAAGCGVAIAVSSIGIPMPPPPNANVGYTAEIRLVLEEVVLAGMVGLVAALLATLLPARRASRLNVVDALRQGT